MAFRKSRLKRLQGSTATEFLFVFPVFLLSSLWVLETSFIWADRHIVDLASFEAARTLVSAPIEYDEVGNQIENPCHRTKALTLAKHVATNRVAIIAQTSTATLAPVAGFNDIAIRNLKSLDDSLRSSLPQALRRLVMRLPSASLATELTCNYDERRENVTVELKYHRPYKIPFIQATLTRINTLTNLEALELGNLRQHEVAQVWSQAEDQLALSYLEQVKRITQPFLSQTEIKRRVLAGRLALVSTSTLPVFWHGESQPFNDDMSLSRSMGWQGRLHMITRLDSKYRIWAHDLSKPSIHIRSGNTQ